MKKFSKAQEHLKRKEFDQAKAVFEELLREDPYNVDVLYNLGMLCTEMGDPREAVETLSRCIDFGHDSVNVYVALGYAYSKLGNHNKAKELFLSALELDSSNPYALRNLGGLYGKETDYERAIQYLNKSYMANPEDANTTYGLGMSYFNSGDVASAEYYLRKTIEIDNLSHLSQMAKDLLREIAAISLKTQGFRTDAMFYCIHAIALFDKAGPAETKRIAFEISQKGQQGLDINNPSKKYTLVSLEGAFTGLQLVSFMYVAFKRIAPDMDVGIDLFEEYDTALNLTRLRGSHEYTFN